MSPKPKVVLFSHDHILVAISLNFLLLFISFYTCTNIIINNFKINLTAFVQQFAIFLMTQNYPILKMLHTSLTGALCSIYVVCNVEKKNISRSAYKFNEFSQNFIIIFSMCIRTKFHPSQINFTKKVSHAVLTRLVIIVSFSSRILSFLTVFSLFCSRYPFLHYFLSKIL